jgi:hypothetical protein
VQDFPKLTSFGLYVGAEHVSRFGDARLMIGPTHYRAAGGGSTLGPQARFEVSTPPLYHVAIVASARGGMMWNLDRRNFQVAAVGLGLGIRP